MEVSGEIIELLSFARSESCWDSELDNPKHLQFDLNYKVGPPR